ncbi:MAG TPA: tannase/feruloyl esterase family alpha/beta hydrolase, partial [Phenylobacterium sp.]|nr:tannase/feruloyl esterase family alpha/beta hydrolase [Phenylobacterium sp.]
TGPNPEQHPRAAGYQFSSNAFKYFAFDDPSFDFLKMDLGAQFDRGRAKMGPIIDAENPNLAAFKRHGGKLIQYHGWNDPAIPARSSIRYYEDVRRTMGDTSGFYRLYLVPGMLHCGGGLSPTNVDWLGELDSWVSEHKAPAAITATASRTGEGASQLLCPFPGVAHKTGEAWSCTAPKRKAGKA